MSTMTVHRYACARCGKRQSTDRMIFSRHTRLRYCADFRACDRRQARKAKDES